MNKALAVVGEQRLWEAYLFFCDVFEFGRLEELEAFWACADRVSVCANADNDMAGKRDLGRHRHD